MIATSALSILAVGSDAFALLALIGAGTVLAIAAYHALKIGLRAPRPPAFPLEVALGGWVGGCGGLIARVALRPPRPPLLGYSEPFLATLLLGSLLVLACAAFMWFTTRPARTNLPRDAARQ